MNGRTVKTTRTLAFALFFLATPAAFAADAPRPVDTPEDDKQRIARLERRIEDLQARIDELQASQAQQNELLAAHQAEIDRLNGSVGTSGRGGDDNGSVVGTSGGDGSDLSRQVRALKERLDALERPVR